MKTVEISFDVKNSYQLVKKHKGKWAGMLAALFMSEDKVKEKIESVMLTEMVKAIEENIGRVLAEQGVTADVQIRTRNGGPKPENPSGDQPSK